MGKPKHGSDAWWRQLAQKSERALGPLGQENLQVLLKTAGVETLAGLPAREASALAWLAGYEEDLVVAIRDALTRDASDRPAQGASHG